MWSIKQQIINYGVRTLRAAGRIPPLCKDLLRTVCKDIRDSKKIIFPTDKNKNKYDS